MAAVEEACEGEAAHAAWRAPRSQNSLCLVEGVGVLSAGNRKSLKHLNRLVMWRDGIGSF